MTYFDQLRAIREAGRQHGLTHIANGTTTPEPELFTREDGTPITGQDVIGYAEAVAPGLFTGVRFDRLSHYEQEDVTDSFDDGYRSAPWPTPENLWPDPDAPAARLEYLRGELRAERISYGELAELQDLIPHIDAGDLELLEAAGVPEFPLEQV